MKSKGVGLLTLAVVSAVVAFGVATPRLAISAVQTQTKHNCDLSIFAGKKTFLCSIVGGDLIASGITSVFFDFKNDAPKNTTLRLMKWSYTGTVYEDSKVVTNANGFNDSQVNAVHAIEQPSQWDYYWTWVENVDTLYGSAVVTK